MSANTWIHVNKPTTKRPHPLKDEKIAGVWRLFETPAYMMVKYDTTAVTLVFFVLLNQKDKAITFS